MSATTQQAWVVQNTCPSGITDEAFAAAYKSNFHTTTSFLRCHGVATELAEELAQAAWTRGWERRAQLRNPSSLCAWINSIALNQLRTHSKFSNRMVQLKDLGTSTVRTLAFLDARNFLCSCTRFDRRILELFYLEGFTTSEIGHATGLKSTTVRVRLFRLRRRLRRACAVGWSKIQGSRDRQPNRSSSQAQVPLDGVALAAQMP
jgi:RNA polymerase sigma factor (sigma-70 family)